MPFYKIIAVFIISFLLTPSFLWSQDSENNKHNLVAMRLIGHQILLDAGNSSSKILPIQQVDNSFRIDFDTVFAFNPNNLSATVDSVMLAENVSDDYIVEVEDCRNHEIVYSYEYSPYPLQSGIPCGLRAYEEGCYSVIITCQDKNESQPELIVSDSPDESNSSLGYWVFGMIVLTTVLVLVVINRRKSALRVSDAMKIGKYEFNKKKLTLSFENELIELTSKEADLLNMLYNSANDTLERETILKVVWEDQGVYVGRTLDVFISKLRKKLEADASIKILNIRGVGYKLVLDN